MEKLQISNSKVKYNNLLIPVIDISASMDGLSIKQVKYKLRMLKDRVYKNKLLTTVVIYNLSSFSIDINKRRSHSETSFKIE